MTKIIFSADTLKELLNNPPDILFYDDKLPAPPFAGRSFPITVDEEAKSLATVEQLWEKMIGLNRQSKVAFMGGGTLLDLGGFAASTYMRGIATYLIPTTFLAMVDACYGGKTAFNYKGIKNLIGSFHPAQEIWIDTSFLKNLPERQFRSGMAEAIKIALAFDLAFFEEIEKGLPLENLIKKALLLKKRVVEEDPYDKGIRSHLNLGHTFAHALESETNYTYFTHGEAVAQGILWASQLSSLDENSQLRIESLLKKYQLLHLLPPLNPDRLVEWMKKDKKNKQGKMTLILFEKIGKAAINDDVDPQRIRDHLRGSLIPPSL